MIDVKRKTKSVEFRPGGRLERWARTHSPFQQPAFTGWHWLLTVVFLVTVVGVLLAPGLAADLGGRQVGPTYRERLPSWEMGQLARITVACLYAWSLLGVRAMHPLAYAGQLAALVYLFFRISEVRITHEPLTVMWLALLFALALPAIRAITRPTDTELIELQRRRIRELEAQVKAHQEVPREG
jgi:hypothetical protein